MSAYPDFFSSFLFLEKETLFVDLSLRGKRNNYLARRHDTQHNDIQPNDIHYDDTQQKGLIVSDTQHE